MNINLKIYSEPAAEPLSVSDVKLWSKIGYATEDAIITSLIKVARRQTENYLWRVLITQTWDLFMDEFAFDPARCHPLYYITPRYGILEIPKGQLQSVTYVKYVDTTEQQVTMNTNDYQVDTNTDPGRIYFKNIPAITTNMLSPINIRFVCGYGNAGSNIPEDIKHAMLVQIAYLYEHREDGVMPDQLHSTSKNILANYRLKDF